MSIDLSKEFRIAIAKAGGQKIVALKLGLSEPELSRKLSGERGWKIGELEKLLGIADMYLSNGNKDVGDFRLIKEMARKLSETMMVLDEFQTIKKKGDGESG